LSDYYALSWDATPSRCQDIGGVFSYWDIQVQRGASAGWTSLTGATNAPKTWEPSLYGDLYTKDMYGATFSYKVAAACAMPSTTTVTMSTYSNVVSVATPLPTTASAPVFYPLFRFYGPSWAMVRLENTSFFSCSDLSSPSTSLNYEIQVATNDTVYERFPPAMPDAAFSTITSIPVASVMGDRVVQNVTGLAASQTYYFRARLTCSNADQSSPWTYGAGRTGFVDAVTGPLDMYANKPSPPRFPMIQNLGTTGVMVQFVQPTIGCHMISRGRSSYMAVFTDMGGQTSNVTCQKLADPNIRELEYVLCFMQKLTPASQYTVQAMTMCSASMKSELSPSMTFQTYGNFGSLLRNFAFSSPNMFVTSVNARQAASSLSTISLATQALTFTSDVDLTPLTFSAYFTLSTATCGAPTSVSKRTSVSGNVAGTKYTVTVAISQPGTYKLCMYSDTDRSPVNYYEVATPTVTVAYDPSLATPIINPQTPVGNAFLINVQTPAAYSIAYHETQYSADNGGTWVDMSNACGGYMRNVDNSDGRPSAGYFVGNSCLVEISRLTVSTTGATVLLRSRSVTTIATVSPWSETRTVTIPKMMPMPTVVANFITFDSIAVKTSSTGSFVAQIGALQSNQIVPASSVMQWVDCSTTTSSNIYLFTGLTAGQSYVVRIQAASTATAASSAWLYVGVLTTLSMTDMPSIDPSMVLRGYDLVIVGLTFPSTFTALQTTLSYGVVSQLSDIPKLPTTLPYTAAVGRAMFLNWIFAPATADAGSYIVTSVAGSANRVPIRLRLRDNDLFKSATPLLTTTNRGTWFTLYANDDPTGEVYEYFWVNRADGCGMPSKMVGKVNIFTDTDGVVDQAIEMAFPTAGSYQLCFRSSAAHFWAYTHKSFATGYADFVSAAIVTVTDTFPAPPPAPATYINSITPSSVLAGRTYTVADFTIGSSTVVTGTMIALSLDPKCATYGVSVDVGSSASQIYFCVGSYDPSVAPVTSVVNVKVMPLMVENISWSPAKRVFTPGDVLRVSWKPLTQPSGSAVGLFGATLVIPGIVSQAVDLGAGSAAITLPNVTRPVISQCIYMMAPGVTSFNRYCGISISAGSMLSNSSGLAIEVGTSGIVLTVPPFAVASGGPVSVSVEQKDSTSGLVAASGTLQSPVVGLLPHGLQFIPSAGATVDIPFNAASSDVSSVMIQRLASDSANGWQTLSSSSFQVLAASSVDPNIKTSYVARVTLSSFSYYGVFTPATPGGGSSSNSKSDDKVNVAAIVVPIVLIVVFGIAGAVGYVIYKKKRTAAAAMRYRGMHDPSDAAYVRA
jgi:hypothetical protein